MRKKIIFKFPDIEKQYADSLQKELRERKSISELLDYWLPSEDLNYSFYSFLEGILFNNDVIGLEFDCQFSKINYSFENIVNEVKKFKENYQYNVLLDDKNYFTFSFLVIDNKLLTINNSGNLNLKDSSKEKKNLISSFANKDLDVNDFFNFERYVTNDFFKKNLEQFNYDTLLDDVNLKFFFRENILVDASFDTPQNEYSNFLKMLDKFLYFSLNRPIREIADHSAIKAMNFFFNNTSKNHGVITIKHPACKAFFKIQEKFRKILIDLEGNKNYANDYKNLNEFFETPPDSWVKMSKVEKIKKCNEFCLLSIRRLSLEEGSIKISNIDKNLRGYDIRIVVEFSAGFDINEKRRVLRFLEDLINKSYNYCFDVIAVMSKDKSVLRRKLKF